MSLHILIGHEKPGQRGLTQALYSGPSGVDLQAAKARSTCGSFTILSNPQGQRKSNAAYDPVQPFQTLEAPASAVPSPALEIPADIAALKKPELVLALTAAIARIELLEAAVVAAAAAAESTDDEPV